MDSRIRRGAALTQVLIVTAVLILALVFFGPGSGSSRPATSAGAPESAPTAQVQASTSSTVSQAVQLSQWLAKEYAPQNH